MALAGEKISAVTAVLAADVAERCSPAAPGAVAGRCW